MPPRRFSARLALDDGSDRQSRRVWSTQTERRGTLADSVLAAAVIVLIALAYRRLRG
jgi:hypothetical protein